MKTCGGCGEEKPFEAFSKNKKGKFGLHSRCRECKRNASYVVNRDKLIERQRQYYRDNKAQHIAHNAKYRATKLGQTPDMATDELDELKMIYAFSQELSKEPDFGLQHVDHIKPLSKGGLHHPDNLQVLTAEENLRKSASWL